jgi:phosphoenolpyruvate carboxykinase (GTP)
MRVLEWIIARCESRGEAVETPVGHLPLASGLRTEGLQMPAQDLEALLTIEADAWQNELEEVERFMLELGERTPAVLVEELRRRRALLSERKAA